jgi:hypothetical protein
VRRCQHCSQIAEATTPNTAKQNRDKQTNRGAIISEVRSLAQTCALALCCRELCSLLVPLDPTPPDSKSHARATGRLIARRSPCSLATPRAHRRREDSTVPSVAVF